ncbi:MAG: DegV family protein [Oscillospiraceae bacterium]|nr:DegV family protein [Oscillospiraceae bacterium]
MSYQIFTDVTADLCPEMLAGLPAVEFVPMEVELGERSYTYGPGGNLTVPQFYAAQRGGAFATTSQINPTVYREAFEPCLERGEDILYLCFSSGLSGTIQGARLCIEELREAYPERRILCVDTLCASIGEGLLVQEAARRQAQGMGLEELAAWAEENRLRVCHWFTVDEFDHLRHGGRVSGFVAAAGTLLQIKPLLFVDNEGKLEVAEKPRGRRRATESQLARIERCWRAQLGRTMVIGHGDCPEDAALLREAVERRFPEAETFVAEIGPIIGAHTGPGMLAVVCWGESR